MCNENKRLSSEEAVLYIKQKYDINFTERDLLYIQSILPKVLVIDNDNEFYNKSVIDNYYTLEDKQIDNYLLLNQCILRIKLKHKTTISRQGLYHIASKIPNCIKRTPDKKHLLFNKKLIDKYYITKTEETGDYVLIREASKITGYPIYMITNLIRFKKMPFKIYRHKKHVLVSDVYKYRALIKE